MKKFLMIIITIICSIEIWGQKISVVNIGNKVLEKNNFAVAKQIFEESGLPLNPDWLSNSPETHAATALGNNKYYGLVASINAFSKTNKRIKEVSFLIGEYYQESVVDDLNRLGYKQIGGVDTVPLGNGSYVPQVTYTNGTKWCFVKNLDNGVALLITFKHKTSTTSKK